MDQPVPDLSRSCRAGNPPVAKTTLDTPRLNDTTKDIGIRQSRFYQYYNGLSSLRSIPHNVRLCLSGGGGVKTVLTAMRCMLVGGGRQGVSDIRSLTVLAFYSIDEHNGVNS